MSLITQLYNYTVRRRAPEGEEVKESAGAKARAGGLEGCNIIIGKHMEGFNIIIGKHMAIS